MKSLSVSKFKAVCLAVLEEVRRSGEPVLITKRGEPLAEVIPVTTPSGSKRTLGALSSTGRVEGDIVEPIGDEGWETLAE